MSRIDIFVILDNGNKWYIEVDEAETYDFMQYIVLSNHISRNLSFLNFDYFYPSDYNWEGWNSLNWREGTYTPYCDKCDWSTHTYHATEHKTEEIKR